MASERIHILRVELRAALELAEAGRPLTSAACHESGVSSLIGLQV